MAELPDDIFRRLDVKRFIAVFLVLSSVAASAVAAAFSYGLSATGESIGSSSFGGVGIDLEIGVFDDPYLNLGTEVVLSPFFESVQLYVSTYPLATLAHPFSFMFTNSMLYNPGLRLGGRFSPSSGWSLRAELAILMLRDTKFRYEFFSPIVSYSFSDSSFGWGITLLRVSYVF